MSEPSEELAQWIDSTVIAGAILEELEEQEIPATLENAQQVWLDAIEELHHLLKSSIVGLVNRGELKTE